MTFQTVLLDASHKKSEFKCGKVPLDNYIHTQASQDAKRRLCVCFVFADEAGYIKGYYTLSNDSVDRNLLPEELKNKLPRAYQNLPVTLLGRLARDTQYSKQGIGELLLIDALKRSFDISSTSVGSMAVVVDLLDDEAAFFYKKFGFISLVSSGRMFLPMKTIGTLFS